MRIAINGCGRIGKSFIRAYLQDAQARKEITLAAINVGKADKETIALSLAYDTLLGPYPGTCEYKDGVLTIDGTLEVAIMSELDPARAPWKELKIDWVVESSGCFTDREGALKHCTAGASQVLISAPSPDADVTVIPGVNLEKYDVTQHRVVSLGSCTTNAVYPMLQVIHKAFSIEYAFMTTVHAYTNTQALLDVDPRLKDPRKSRAAALNIVPTTTGAMKVVDQVMPELAGKLSGMALRVPVGKVSLIDLVVSCAQELSREQVHNEFKKAAKEHPHILACTDLPLVSSDYAGSSHSVTIDNLLTSVQGSTAKLFGWYDNEWGYSVRLKDFLLHARAAG